MALLNSLRLGALVMVTIVGGCTFAPHHRVIEYGPLGVGGDDVAVFYFDDVRPLEHVVKVIKGDGWEPATVENLRVFMEEYPDEHLSGPSIMALGSFEGGDGGDVPCLRRGNRLASCFIPFAVGLHFKTRFLAVRRSSSGI